MTDKHRIYRAITENISISVIPKYESEESNPAIGKFVYSYEVKPGETFMYTSWCPLHSPIGKMYGNYVFVNLSERTTFKVLIPEFLLVSDFKLN